MRIELILHRVFWVFVIAPLVACGQQTATSPTKTSIPTTVVSSVVPTSTLIPITITPSPLPTEPIVPIITPDVIQAERWMEYQTALAKSFLPHLSPEEVVCEWEILGQSDKEIYVWAICTGTSGPGTLEDPAVIYIEEDGSVQTVKIPRGGTNYASDIREMFPIEAQEKYFSRVFHFKELTDHLYWRQDNPESPPLIVLSATPTP